MKARAMAAMMVGAALVATGFGGWSRLSGGEPVEFDEAHMYIEFNASAGDVGMQVFLDGDPWRELRVFRPDGKLIMEVRGRRSLALQGFTEFFFESSEPPLASLPLPVFLARFPAGEYTFKGLTIDGEPIEATAEFTHAIPQKPVVIVPPQGSVQDPGNTLVTWLPVPNPPGSTIAAYQVTVTQELDVFPKRVFSVHLPAGTTSVKVPSAFMQHDAEYEFEVLAIEEGGNQTIHAGAFTTAP